MFIVSECMKVFQNVLIVNLGDDFPNAQSLLEAVWEIESPGELAGGEVPGNQSATAKSEPPSGEAAPASAPASTANTTSSATSSPKQAESKSKQLRSQPLLLGSIHAYT